MKMSDFKITKRSSFNPPQKLKPEQVKRDMDFLIHALKNGYSGRKFISQTIFKQSIRKISSLRCLNPFDLLEKIDRILLRIPDNHLVAYLKGKASHQRQKLVKTANVGKNSISNVNKAWEVSLKSIYDKKYLLVSISHFPLHTDKIWNGFMEKIKKFTFASDFIVLDLRGNRGGDDTYGFRLAQFLNGGSLRYPGARQHVSQTPESLIIFGNAFRLQLIKAKSSRMPSHFLEFLKKIDKKYELALKGKLRPERIIKFKIPKKKTRNAHAYRKRIYILIDGKCGSSGESSVDAFEFIPFVKTVGQNTAGYIHFGNVGYILLPASKILIQIPTHYNEYFDKRFIERKGITPDIKLKNQDALDYVLKLERYHRSF